MNDAALHRPTPSQAVADAPGGETGALMRARDWSATPLGPREDWPASLWTLVDVMLGSQQPMFVAWGPERVMLYNDGYAELCRDRHPAALGAPFAEVWYDILEHVGPILERAFAGIPTHMDDIAFQLMRDGRPQEAHFAFSYTPVRGEDGRVEGMFCACTKTTRQVLAERQRSVDIERQRRMFEQAPGFICTLTGPDHAFDFVNDAFRRLFGDRGYLGKPVREAFPDLTGQGFYELLDRVYATGERHVAHAAPARLRASPDGPEQELVLDFIYAPVVDERGAVVGVFCEGHDVTEAHRGGAALRESEERLRLVVEGAKDHAILTTDPQGTITSWSAGASAIFGWSEEAAVGQPVAILFTPEDRAAGAAEHELAAAASNGCANDERWHLRRDGSRVFMNGSVYPLPRDEQGREQGFLKIARDETERRARADALFESELRFRNMADHAPVMMWVTDATGYCTYLNRRWYEFTGQAEDEALGLGWTKATHPDDQQLAEDAFLQANRARGPFRVEYRLRRADGVYRWAIDAASPRFGEDGTFLGYVGSVIDIDERRETEDRLRESEGHYRSFVELNPQVAWTATPDGQLDHVSRRWLEWTGTTGLGATWAEGLHPDDQERTFDVWGRSVATGEPYDVEHRVKMVDGTYRWARSRAFPRLDGGGGIVKWYGTTEDIHERRAGEEAQELLINELNHRVKNTLTTVQSIAAQTLRNARSTEEAGRAFEGRLLALSKAHDVLTRENWEGAALREIVAQAVAPYASRGEDRLHVSGPEARLSPRSALALAMALQELATNAVKYGALSNSTGEIQITWSLGRAAEATYLHLRWEESGGPPVAPPERRGFGSRLIERSLAQDLGGEVRIAYEPSGVVCTVDAPLDGA